MKRYMSIIGLAQIREILKVKQYKTSHEETTINSVSAIKNAVNDNSIAVIVCYSGHKEVIVGDTNTDLDNIPELCLTTDTMTTSIEHKIMGKVVDTMKRSGIAYDGLISDLESGLPDSIYNDHTILEAVIVTRKDTC